MPLNLHTLLITNAYLVLLPFTDNFTKSFLVNENLITSLTKQSSDLVICPLYVQQTYVVRTADINCPSVPYSFLHEGKF